ncbi:sigma factor-like helix-turn-helix DNA-binding protein [Peptoniphilus genitalis]
MSRIKLLMEIKEDAENLASSIGILLAALESDEELPKEEEKVNQNKKIYEIEDVRKILADKSRLGHTAKIKEEWVKAYRESLLEEHYNNKKNEREDRHTSLEEFTYEEGKYFDSGLDQEEDYISNENLMEMLNPLNDRQKYLIQKCVLESYSYSEIAREEGKDESAIRKAVKRALEKIKKNLI